MDISILRFALTPNSRFADAARQGGVLAYFGDRRKRWI